MGRQLKISSFECGIVYIAVSVTPPTRVNARRHEVYVGESLPKSSIQYTCITWHVRKHATLRVCNLKPQELNNATIVDWQSRLLVTSENEIKVLTWWQPSL